MSVLPFSKSFEPLVDAKEAAKFLNCSPLTARRMAKAGRLPAVAFPVGRNTVWKFRMSELNDFVESLMRKPIQGAARQKSVTSAS